MQTNPEMYISNHSDEDNISMLETGYDMIGSIGFEAGSIAPSLALNMQSRLKPMLYWFAVNMLQRN
jgi:hypothetical protein